MTPYCTRCGSRNVEDGYCWNCGYDYAIYGCSLWAVREELRAVVSHAKHGHGTYALFGEPL